MSFFQPSGLTPYFDLTTSSPYDVNTVKVPLNPAISYFAGDIATMQLFIVVDSQVFPEDPTVLPQGFVYPQPVGFTIPSELTNFIIPSWSKLGVFSYFEYTPANSQIPIKSNNFIAGTPLAPRTKAYAYVGCSNSMLYTGQLNLPTSYITETFLYSQWIFGSLVTFDYTYDVVLAGTTYQITLQFPQGDTTRGILGRSQSSLEIPETIVTTPDRPWMLPSQNESILYIGMTNIDGSSFSTEYPWAILNLQFKRFTDSNNI